MQGRLTLWLPGWQFSDNYCPTGDFVPEAIAVSMGLHLAPPEFCALNPPAATAAVPAPQEAVPAPADARREISTIAVVGFAHGVSHFFHLLLAPLFPWLMAEFQLNFTQMGATMTLFFVVSGIGQALAGFAVDRLGARRVLYFGVSCLAAAGVALALAHSYAGLFLAAGLAGLGNAVFHPADFTLLNRHVSAPRLGHAFSIHGLSGNLGWAAAPAFLTGIAALAGWRAAALGASVVALLALGLLVYCRRLLADPCRAAAGDEAPAGAPFAFLQVGAVWLCFGFFLFTTTAFGAFQNFGSPVLQQVYGLSVGAAASAITAFLLGGAGGMALGGFLAGRAMAHERRIALILSMAALLALLLASGTVAAFLVLPLMACIGFCNGLAGPSRDLLVRRAAAARFGQKAFGRVYGFVYSGLDTGLALSPLLFGPLLDGGRFALVLVGVAALQSVAVLTALGVGRRQV